MRRQEYQRQQQQQELEDFKLEYLAKGFTYGGHHIIQGTGNGPMTLSLKNPDRTGYRSVDLKHKENFERVLQLLGQRR